MNPHDPSHLPPEAAEALRAGNKIEAIRIVREKNGLGLKEAKEIVERIGATDPTPVGARPHGAVSRSSCLVFLGAVALSAAAGWYVLA